MSGRGLSPKARTARERVRRRYPRCWYGPAFGAVYETDQGSGGRTLGRGRSEARAWLTAAAGLE